MEQNKYILPISYRTSPRKIIGKYELYSRIQDIAPEIFQKLKKIESLEPIYKPAWGIHYDMNSKIINVEILAHQQHPVYGHYEKDQVITHTEMTGIELPPSRSKTVLCTVSVFDEIPILYYANNAYTHNTQEELYYQLKKEEIIANSYRFFAFHIPIYREFILEEFLFMHRYFKTFFITEYIHENKIRIYYDGLSAQQFDILVKRLKLDIPSIPDALHISVHIDYDKESYQPIGFGIYGILY
jgi:hypothetical protein